MSRLNGHQIVSLVPPTPAIQADPLDAELAKIESALQAIIDRFGPDSFEGMDANSAAGRARAELLDRYEQRRFPSRTAPALHLPPRNDAPADITLVGGIGVPSAQLPPSLVECGRGPVAVSGVIGDDAPGSSASGRPTTPGRPIAVETIPESARLTRILERVPTIPPPAATSAGSPTAAIQQVLLRPDTKTQPLTQLRDPQSDTRCHPLIIDGDRPVVSRAMRAWMSIMLLALSLLAVGGYFAWPRASASAPAPRAQRGPR